MGKKRPRNQVHTTWVNKAPDVKPVPADCRYCGAEIPVDGNNCRKCGALIWRPGANSGERPK